MKMLSIEQELKSNSYPGRGIIIGKSPDGKKAVTAYFIMGRSAFDHVAPKPRVSATISNALKTLGLPPTATLREASAKYRALAKKYHPDTGGSANASEFTKINTAYQTLKKHFGKK